ncbi:MAG: ferric reductase-like transmembrane domain-containing protein [Deltaproteobacteria bacterium]|nr:ferric reductase-like transmembrane domain-containing protein [Deltaproteobacteria bacterium]
MENNHVRINQLSRKARIIWGICLAAVAALFFAGAICVPFFFESQTLRYQLGTARSMLLTGHIMGTAAGLLLLVQMILVCRSRFLDRVFAINRLLLFHRINAIIILVLAVAHMLLILNTLGSQILSFEFSQWPEYTGLILLVMVAGIVFSGLSRGLIGIKFQFWISLHRVFTPVAILLLCIHLYCVSNTFRYDSAYILIICFFAACLLAYFILRLKKLSVFRPAFRVGKIFEAGKNIYSLELAPEKDKAVVYAPGQFAFLKIRSSAISPEEHPFTISSSPTRQPLLQFTIKDSGDWTNRVKEIKAGDKACIHGPFGIFGHINFESRDEIIMIAGGIGITPILSILRYLHDIKSGRKITLLWSNRTQKEVVYADELNNIEKSMTGLSIKYAFTREEGQNKNRARLNRDGLEMLLSGCSRGSIILLCGPPAMMTQVRKDLILIGFSGRSIIEERFSL